MLKRNGQQLGRSKTVVTLRTLYDADEAAWLDRMALLIRKRRYDELDYEHLAELLDDMAKRERREVKHRLEQLLIHLLKWEHQSEKWSRSWRDSIKHQRNRLQDILDSKTLRNFAKGVLDQAFSRAVERAATQTGLSADAFPEDCPYTVEDLLKS